MAKRRGADDTVTAAVQTVGTGQQGEGHGAGPQPGTPPAPAQALMSLGAAAWLMGHSPIHRHLFVADFDWLILPPLMLGQTRLYHDQEKPLAFVAWAFVDESVEARIQAGIPRLQPTDWQSGDRPWLIETIAPFAQPGGVEEIIADLTKTVFGGKRPKVVGEK